MQTQDAGSTEDLDYVGGFYAEMSPVRLNFIAALNGVAGPHLDDGFDYCELGCGLGDTTNLLAASLPQGQFVGIDLSETHIGAAQSLASAGGLENIRFLAADVAALDADALPEFDYITMHGLYSWVPEPVRAAIDAFVRRKLKPGGLLHVSYNAQPGANNLATLRRYYIDRAARMSGSLLERADAITRELESLRQAGAPLFRENPTAQRLFEIIRDNDRRYLVHEMFAEGWQPLAFSQAQSRFAACGLRFIGDSEIMENLLEHCTLPDFTAQVAASGDRLQQEALKDLIHNRSFRRDVYQRPDSSASPPAHDLFDALLLCTTQPRGEVREQVQVTGGTLSLAGGWFDRIRELLEYDVLSVAEILADPVLAGCGRNELRQGLKLACIDGALGPAARRDVSRRTLPLERMTIAAPLNRVLLERFSDQRERLVLASPVTGRGVEVGRMEAVLLAATGRPAPVQWIEQWLRECGISLKRSGGEASASGPIDERAALGQIVEVFCSTRLPKLASLGIVAVT